VGQLVEVSLVMTGVSLLSVESCSELAVMRKKVDASTVSGRSVLTESAAKDSVEFLKLLADETRLRIVYMLKESGELNVQTMCRALGLTQPAVSHHLALLRMAGLVSLRRAGKHNYYSLVPGRFQDHVGQLRQILPVTGNSAPLECAPSEMA